MRKGICIIFILIYFNLVYCDPHNYGNEEFSALALACADMSGNFQVNTQVDTSETQTPSMDYLTRIFPKLRQLYARTLGPNHNVKQAKTAVKNYFKQKVYVDAKRTYEKYFKGVNIKDADSIIKQYDLYRELTTSSTGATALEVFGSDVDLDIWYPPNDDLASIIIDFLKSDGDRMASTKIRLDRNYPNSNNNLISKDLLLEIVTACRKDVRCQKYFKNHNQGNNHNYRGGVDDYLNTEVAFNIVKSTIHDDESNKDITRYHLFTVDKTGKQMAHQFALKFNGKKWERDDDNYPFKEMTFEEIKNIENRKFDYGKNYMKPSSNNRMVIEDPGIEIFTDLGIKLKKNGKEIANYRDGQDMVTRDIIGADYCSGLYIKRSTGGKAYIEELTKRITNANPDIDARKRVLNLLKVLSLIKLFPINSKNEFLGFSIGGGHPEEIRRLFDSITSLDQQINGINPNCRITQKKRATNNLNCPCIKTKIAKTYNVENDINSLLDKFKEKNIDINNLLNIKDANDYFERYENNENFDYFWSDVLFLYEQTSSQFEPQERDDIVKNFNNIINGYKDDISSSDNANVKISEQNISNLENVLNKIVTHNEEMFNEINEVNTIDYNSNTNSKYFKEKLLKVFKKLAKILNKSLKIKLDKENSKLKLDLSSVGDSNNVDEAVENVSKGMNNLDESKNQALMDISDDLDELQSISEYESNYNEESSDNRELITKLGNEVNNKIGKEYNNLEISSSENSLVLDENVDGNSIVDMLKSNDVSNDVKECLLNGLEDDFKDNNDESLIEERYNNINEIKDFIKTKEEELNKYDSLEKHKYKTIKYLKFIKDLNSLIDKINVKEYSSKNNRNNIEKVKLSNELINRIESSSDKELTVALKQINDNSLKNTNYDEMSDKIAFIILASGNENGELIKELDTSGKLVPVSLTVHVNGEEKQLNIKVIIPSLRNLEGEELDKEFSKLYDISIVKYAEKFKNYYDETNDIGIFNEDPKEVIKNENVMSHLLNPYNINEDGNVEHFKLAPEDIYNHVNTNDHLSNSFKTVVALADYIDIDSFDELPENIKEYWSSNLSDEYRDDESLYKTMAVNCIKNIRCKYYFEKSSGISFNIVSYVSKNKESEVINHSLIINDDDNKQICNAFTLNELNNGEYKLDEINGDGYEFSYEDLDSLNNNSNNYEISKIKVEDNEYIEKFSIGLLAECGFDIEKSDGTVLNPSNYALNNEGFNDISDNEIIEKKYAVKNNGKYNMNVVRSDVFDNNVIKSQSDIDINDIPIEELGEQLIKYRNEKDAITDNEIDMLSTYSIYFIIYYYFFIIFLLKKNN